MKRLETSVKRLERDFAVTCATEAQHRFLAEVQIIARDPEAFKAAGRIAAAGVEFGLDSDELREVAEREMPLVQRALDRHYEAQLAAVQEYLAGKGEEATSGASEGEASSDRQP